MSLNPITNFKELAKDDGDVPEWLIIAILLFAFFVIVMIQIWACSLVPEPPLGTNITLGKTVVQTASCLFK